MKIAVSGTTSSIGRAVVKQCLSLGIEIVSLNRTGSEINFNLANPIDFVLENIDAFIHLAWDWTDDEIESYRRNITNLLPFLDSLTSSGTNLVLLSSESANLKAGSNYGELKFQLEQEFSKRKGSSIRAGLLWGASLSGMVATICKLSKIKGICVHLIPDPSFSVSNESEIAMELVSQALKGHSSNSIMSLKSQSKVRLSDISHAFRGLGKSAVHLRVSVQLLVLIGSLMTKLGIELPFRVDSLRTLLGKSHEQANAKVRVKHTETTTQDFLAWILLARG